MLTAVFTTAPPFSINHSSNPKELLLARLRDKPFWIWNSAAQKEKDRTRRGYCCFNPIISLPKKDRIEKPFFDYEKMLYLALLMPDYLNSITGHPGPAYKFKLKHLWVKKATGLGVTEFMLRLWPESSLFSTEYRDGMMEGELQASPNEIPLSSFQKIVPVNYMPEIMQKHHFYKMFICNNCGYLKIFDKARVSIS